MAGEHESRANTPRPSIASGLAWNTIFQIFIAIVGFIAMLFMVRLVSKADYGRAAAAVALIAIANVFGAPTFVAHALQLPEEETPDWTLHWNVTLPLQVALFLALNAIAGVMWLSDTYRPIAGLVHVGSIGIMLEWPAQIGNYTLKRDLDFRRLRILQGISGAFNAAAMVAMAALGFGAYALIIGNNVLPALAFTIDLLILRRWRPDNGWWSRPDVSQYQAAARFGTQNIGSGLLGRARVFVEGMVLPVAAGYSDMGIMNRASGLHSLTVLRVEGILVETVYPLLPRAASDPQRFMRVATIYTQIVILTSTCGSIAVGIMGKSLSRLFYGELWAGADPYIWPAALLGLGFTIAAVCSSVLLSRGRLRATFMLNALAAVLSLPMVIVALHKGSLLPYVWALAAAQAVTAAVALHTTVEYFQPGWKRDILLPPVVVAGTSAAVLVLAEPALGSMPLFVRVAIAGLLFTATAVIITRVLFPRVAARILERLPGASRTLAFFRVQQWSGQ